MFCILDIGIVLLDVLTERVNLEKMCTEFGLVLAEAGFSFFSLVHLVHDIVKETNHLYIKTHTTPVTSCLVGPNSLLLQYQVDSSHISSVRLQ